MSKRAPRFRIVTGKGGVGKTTVATALAVAAAKRGRRVLVVEANGGDRVAALLGAAPVGFAMREVREHLFVVDSNPRDAIREYALLTLRFETIYKAVFENRLVRRFVRLVPSLNELVLLGKIWHHEQEQRDGRARFDEIILDAPSTGHAVSMLRAPAVVRRTVPAGPLRENCDLMCELLTDPVRTVMHIVTTPEEMPVNEAVELEQAASDILQIRLGTTFINQHVDRAQPEVLASLAALADDPDLAGALLALRIRDTKAAAGDAHIARLPGHMLANAVRLPRLVGETFGPHAVETLATAVAEEQS